MDPPIDSTTDKQPMLESDFQKTLKEPSLEVDYSLSMDLHPHLPPPDEIKKIILNAIRGVEELKLEVKQNERLEKYFNQAKANGDQICVSLANIEKSLQEMLEAMDQIGVNMPILVEVVMFIDKIQLNFDPKKLKNVDKAIWILEFDTKVRCCLELFTNSLFIPLDITTLPKHKYESVWSRVQSEVVGDDKKVQEGLLFLKKVMAITTSAVLNEQSCGNAVSKLMSFGLSYPKYLFSDKEGQLRSMIFHRNPTIDMAKCIWNLPQNGMIMEVAKIGLKSIKTNTKIYIPFKEGVLPKKICEDDGQSIQVRLLHNDIIHFKKKGDNKSEGSSGIGCICTSPELQEPLDHSTVILHIHGGGFIALSSRSMQVHTRRWANALKVPIFSVDYRMPAEHVFPTAPYDCLRVYEFLINHAHKFMNVRPKRIVLAGDSAGGNLAFALMALILKHNLPPPIGIYTAYPACDLRFQFSPSKLHSFTDPLLHPPMLVLCLTEYLKGKLEEQNNPLASPLLLTEQFVGGEVGDKRFPLKWPKTIIQVGQKDPLFDSSLMTMERMVQSGIDVQCQIYENLSHGFLNLDMVVPECKKTIDDSILHLRELMKDRIMMQM